MIRRASGDSEGQRRYGAHMIGEAIQPGEQRRVSIRSVEQFRCEAEQFVGFLAVHDCQEIGATRKIAVQRRAAHTGPPRDLVQDQVVPLLGNKLPGGGHNACGIAGTVRAPHRHQLDHAVQSP